MDKCITVKGVGIVSKKPDFTEIDIKLKSKDANYSKALESALEQFNKIKDSLENSGFDKGTLKTISINVMANYVTDEHHFQTTEIEGYICYHDLKLSFGLNNNDLLKALICISDSTINPELRVTFSLKDITEVNEQLLKEAAFNGHNKAEVLAHALDVKLGALISVDYTWKEENLFSETVYNLNDQSRFSIGLGEKSLSIEPEDIYVKDIVTFVWEIL